MATIITETPGALDGSAAVPLTGTRSRRRPASAGGGAARRTRRTSLAGDALVASLTEMVDELIKENRQLKRAIAQAEKSAGGSGGLGQAARALSGLQRRVDRALSGSATARGRRTAAPAAASRPRRKVTDPEVLERRRQALVKARAARQAKRQAAAQ